MSNQVDIFYYDYNNEVIIDNLNKFSDYRIKKGLSNKNLATEYVLIKIIEKKLNKKISKLDILTSDNNKPYLDNIPKMHFSISHCNDHLLIAVSNSNVGIDIEEVKERKKNISLKIYEKVSFNLDKTIKDWTILEAYIKFFDLSMLIDLKKIKILDKTIESKYGNVCYKTFKFSDYYYSVVQKDDFEVNFIDLNRLIIEKHLIIK